MNNNLNDEQNQNLGNSEVGINNIPPVMDTPVAPVEPTDQPITSDDSIIKPAFIPDPNAQPVPPLEPVNIVPNEEPKADNSKVNDKKKKGLSPIIIILIFVIVIAIIGFGIKLGLNYITNTKNSNNTSSGNNVTNTVNENAINDNNTNENTNENTNITIINNSNTTNTTNTGTTNTNSNTVNAGTTNTTTSSSSNSSALDSYLEQLNKTAKDSSNDQVTASVYVENNSLIYSYKYTTTYTTDQVATVKTNLESTFDSGNYDAIYKAALSETKSVDSSIKSVIIKYLNGDGSTIYSKEFTA